jgi:rSAM-associated Gly-rich repeat protein
MILSPRALKTLLALLPMGALGISSVLAAAPPKIAPSPSIGDTQQVAARLQAIRSAVSQATAEEHGLEPGDPNIRKVWWANVTPGFGWRNGGWRNGGWANGWRNGGWPNGWGNGWRNGGWPNGWGNGWRN